MSAMLCCFSCVLFLIFLHATTSFRSFLSISVFFFFLVFALSLKWKVLLLVTKGILKYCCSVNLSWKPKVTLLAISYLFVHFLHFCFPMVFPCFFLVFVVLNFLHFFHCLFILILWLCNNNNNMLFEVDILSELFVLAACVALNWSGWLDMLASYNFSFSCIKKLIHHVRFFVFGCI